MSAVYSKASRGRSSAERRLVRTVGPLTNSNVEVTVLARACHDSVMVGLCAHVCL